MEETQTVTVPREFYNHLIVKALALELFEKALVENAEKDYRKKPNVSDNFIYAVKAILPDTYAKMAEKAAKSEEE